MRCHLRFLPGLLLAALLLAVLACQDDAHKTTGSCDADGDCAGGVCFDQTCYQVCEAQDECAEDEYCARREDKSGRETAICIVASSHAGCGGDADCADLVGGPCVTPGCDVESGLCAFEGLADDAACTTVAGEPGACQAEVCVADCAPSCAEKACGGDGCGGSCGVCSADDLCANTCTVDGQCAPAFVEEDLCDGLDEDCDGQTDEPFKDEGGLFTSDAHCGACGLDCVASAPEHSVGACEPWEAGVACVFTCLEGHVDLNDSLEDGCECPFVSEADYVDEAGLDENCDGVDGVDADGDTYASVASGGDDCDDDDAEVYVGQFDPIGDGVDQNCDGSDGETVTEKVWETGCAPEDMEGVYGYGDWIVYSCWTTQSLHGWNHVSGETWSEAMGAILDAYAYPDLALGGLFGMYGATSASFDEQGRPLGGMTILGTTAIDVGLMGDGLVHRYTARNEPTVSDDSDAGASTLDAGADAQLRWVRAVPGADRVVAVDTETDLAHVFHASSHELLFSAPTGYTVDRVAVAGRYVFMSTNEGSSGGSSNDSNVVILDTVTGATHVVEVVNGGLQGIDATLLPGGYAAFAVGTESNGWALGVIDPTGAETCSDQFEDTLVRDVAFDGGGGDWVFAQMDGSLYGYPTLSRLCDTWPGQAPDNHMPVASDDVATADYEAPVVIDVLLNDYDPNLDPLSITGFTDGLHGSVSEAGAGELKYTPGIGFAGEDAFTYTISDGQETATATVTVTVADQACEVIEVSGTLEAGVTTTWSDNASGKRVYHIATLVTVPEGAALVIEAGVVVKMGNYAQITVEGELQVLGTEDVGVLFTSAHDDSDGCDVTGDGDATAPVAGSWQRLSLGEGAHLIEHARFRYGATAVQQYASEETTSVTLRQVTASDFSGDCVFVSGVGPVTIEGLEVARCGGYGAGLSSPSLSLSGFTASDSVAAGLWLWQTHGAALAELVITGSGGPAIEASDAWGMSLLGASLTAAVGSGLRVEHGTWSTNPAGNGGTFAAFEDVTVSGCAQVLYTDDPSVVPALADGNALLGNTRDVIEIWGTKDLDAPASWAYPGLVIHARRNILIQDTASLTIGAGVIVKLAPPDIWGTAGFLAGGDLAIQGSAEAPVVLTSLYDDTAGGDTNGDGDTTQPAPGDWGSVEANLGTVTVSHAQLRYGEEGLYSAYNIDSGAVSASNTTLTDFSEDCISLRACGAVDLADLNVSSCGDRCVEVSEAATTSLTGLDVASCGTKGVEITLADGAALSDITISGAGEQGLYMSSSDGLSVTGVTVTGASGAGVEAQSASFSSFTGVTVSGCGWPLTTDEPVLPIHAASGNQLVGNTVDVVEMDGDVDADVVWDVPGLVIQGSSIDVLEGARLTLGPGVSVKLLYALKVQGELAATGTAEAPIRFTSYRDDLIGGDSNRDGDETSPAAGDWNGIWIRDAGSATLARVDVRYAWDGVDLSCNSDLTCALSLSDSIVHDVHAACVTLEYGSATLQDVEVSACGGDCVSGLDLQALTLAGVDVAECGVRGLDISGTTSAALSDLSASDTAQEGVYLSGCAGASLDGAVVTGAGAAGVSAAGTTSFTSFTGIDVSGSDSGLSTGDVNVDLSATSGNSFTGNARDLVELTGVYLDLAADATWDMPGIVYVLHHAVAVPADVSLTIGAGAVVKASGSNAEFDVDGALTLAGTADQPVVLTSFKDDSAGGDSNGDVDASAPAPGDWDQIRLGVDASVSMTHADLRYGSYGLYHYSTSGGATTYAVSLGDTSLYGFSSDCVQVRYGASVSLVDSTLSDCGGDCLQATLTTDLSMTGVDLMSCGDRGANLMSLSAPALSNVTVTGAGDEGLYLDDCVGTSLSAATVTGAGQEGIDANGTTSFVAFSGVDVNGCARPLVTCDATIDLSTAGGNQLTGNSDDRIELYGSGMELGDDTTWDLSGVTYYLRSTVDVLAGATLTLGPGAVIKAGGSAGGIDVLGALVANGSVDEPVVFTSIKDDTVGGDSNEDADGSAPAAGDWGDVVVGPDGAVTMSHVQMRYGTYGLYHASGTGSLAVNLSDATLSDFSSDCLQVRYGDALTVTDSSLTRCGSDCLYAADLNSLSLSGVSVSDCGDRGIWLANLSDPSLTDVTVTTTGDEGVYLDDCEQITLNGATVTGAGLEGVDAYGTTSFAAFTGIDVSGCAQALSTSDPNIDLSSASGNQLSGNTLDRVDIYGPDPVLVADATWDMTDVVYVVRSTLDVQAGATLTLAPGTIVKLNTSAGGIDLYGGLVAAGTVDLPIVFTSLKDDGVGGDSNGDADATAPAAGDWGDVLLKDGAAVTLQHARFRYGTYALYRNSGSGGFSVDLQDCQIADFSADCLQLRHGDALNVARTTITGCGSDGIFAGWLPSFTLEGLTITGCVDRGLSLQDLSDPSLSVVSVHDVGDEGIYLDDCAGVLLDGATVTGAGLEGVDAKGTTTLASFTDITVSGCDTPLYSSDPTIPIHAAAGNALTGNTADRVEIGGNVNEMTADVLWDDPALVVYLTTSLDVTAGTTLSVGPGVVVKGKGGSTRLNVMGSMEALGAVDEPIVFTSYLDDGAGGDSNADGDATSPAAGDWGGLSVMNDEATLQMSHVEVAYANKGLYVVDWTGDPAITGSVSDCSFHDMSQYCIDDDQHAALSFSSMTYADCGTANVNVH